MRKIRNIRKDDAVSPVIATILMVAITVVLAAVLYVMVMGMTGNGGGATASGNWQHMTKDSSTKETLTFGKFTQEVKWMDIQISVKNSTDTYTFTFTDNTPTVGTVSHSGSGAALTVTATDLASNEVINSGDSIALSWASAPTGTFTVTLLDVQSGDQITMAGGSTFTM